MGTLQDEQLPQARRGKPLLSQPRHQSVRPSAACLDSAEEEECKEAMLLSVVPSSGQRRQTDDGGRIWMVPFEAWMRERFGMVVNFSISTGPIKNLTRIQGRNRAGQATASSSPWTPAGFLHIPRWRTPFHILDDISIPATGYLGDVLWNGSPSLFPGILSMGSRWNESSQSSRDAQVGRKWAGASPLRCSLYDPSASDPSLSLSPEDALGAPEGRGVVC